VINRNGENQDAVCLQFRRQVIPYRSGKSQFADLNFGDNFPEAGYADPNFGRG